MERDDFVMDEMLKKLAGRVPLESPSDDFTSKVMAGINVRPETVKAGNPFYLFIKTAWPWLLLGIFVVVFLLSSDIPYLSFIPGKEFFHDHVAPYFSAFFVGIAKMFMGSKAVSITLALMASGGLLVGLDWLLRRRSDARHHAA